VTDHSIFDSIYFFDPNGHRLELAYLDPAKAMVINTVYGDHASTYLRGPRLPFDTAVQVI
jgi:hypothetical protein